ncbi:MAG: alpha/beta hydrolase [Vicingaceae bacterium]|nr:alpha/beta hydrolase [Vicingaceae bacterium]
MKIYGISGLGADESVFKYLNLKHKIIPLAWIKHDKNESLEHYASRLAANIDINEDFGVLGVSFGGLVAVEISKILNPKVTILISSVETKDELGFLIKGLGKMNLVKYLPSKIFNPPKKIAHFLFGTDNKELLNKILDDTDLDFTKWAVNELLNWKNTTTLSSIIKISGTNDKLLPPTKANNTILIEKGEHFMIVDKANEISELINLHPYFS